LVAPLKPLRAFSVGNSSETIKDIRALSGFRGVTDGVCP
jgi:hypothetical protein